nr:MAG TPA: hypothetical protein [Caudoviricetes sp.]
MRAKKSGNWNGFYAVNITAREISTPIIGTPNQRVNDHSHGLIFVVVGSVEGDCKIA